MLTKLGFFQIDERQLITIIAVSHAFGFGLMNAHAMVMKARSWSPVPQQRTCFRTVISDDHSPRFIPANVAFVVPVQVVAL